MSEAYGEWWDLRTVIRNLNLSFYNAGFPFRGYHRLVAAPTTISIAGTYYKTAGTSTARALNGFTHSDNRLTYIGEDDKHFHLAASLSFTCGGTNQTIGWKMAKNGVVDDGTVVRRRVGTGTDIGSTALHADFTLSTNDYIEIWCTNETSTNSVTLDEFYVFGMGMPTV